MGRVLSLRELLEARARVQAEGKIVILTNGCFDLLHLGHVEYLRKAKALGDVLVVAVNSDASTKRLKGPLRPILPEATRAGIVAALAWVDYVVVFEEDTAEKLVGAMRPEVYVKGGDYEAEGKALPEAAAVASYGGKVVLLPLVPGYSTSEIIETILNRYRAAHTAHAQP